MEIRQFCLNILNSPDLGTKLEAPSAPLTDNEPGPPIDIPGPARVPELSIESARKVNVPPLIGAKDPQQRARILHAMANHELQAVELFAWCLLAFPDTPASFRLGALAILRDEQRHCKMYIDCIERLGAQFGQFGVTGHFWKKRPLLTSPLAFVCTMGLTFENANLDFCTEYEQEFRRLGDEFSAQAVQEVHEDEIRHVRFAWKWFKHFSGEPENLWETYLQTIQWPLGPHRARGKTFNEEARRKSGLDEDFIRRLGEIIATRPGGTPR